MFLRIGFDTAHLAEGRKKSFQNGGIRAFPTSSSENISLSLQPGSRPSSTTELSSWLTTGCAQFLLLLAAKLILAIYQKEDSSPAHMEYLDCPVK
mmetsp:Transcript_30872/g.72776  ORF Transcript_30872/g.72776 Transcript_30872/m.72776 type:complete len:95 (-) Transcript_30872:62-346(-)